MLQRNLSSWTWSHDENQQLSIYNRFVQTVPYIPCSCKQFTYSGLGCVLQYLTLEIAACGEGKTQANPVLLRGLPPYLIDPYWTYICRYSLCLNQRNSTGTAQDWRFSDAVRFCPASGGTSQWSFGGDGGTRAVVWGENTRNKNVRIYIKI